MSKKYEQDQDEVERQVEEIFKDFEPNGGSVSASAANLVGWIILVAVCVMFVAKYLSTSCS